MMNYYVLVNKLIVEEGQTGLLSISSREYILLSKLINFCNSPASMNQPLTNRENILMETPSTQTHQAIEDVSEAG